MEPMQPESGDVPPTAKLKPFFAELAASERRLLLLDYDGTLAPFHSDPAQAKPYNGVRERLEAITRDPRSQLVIVTGRPARDIWPLLDLARRPTVWGSYGWELLDANGGYRCGPLDPGPLRQLLRQPDWIAAIEQCGGRVETKAGGVAIHWRGLAPDAVDQIRTVVRREWNSHDWDRALDWTDFDGGVELRLPGRDKGYAVRAILRDHPDATAAYLGDDLADERAFEAIKPRGLGVLVRDRRRPTAAEAWLRPPAELLDFLDAWRACGQQGPR